MRMKGFTVAASLFAFIFGRRRVLKYLKTNMEVERGGHCNGNIFDRTAQRTRDKNVLYGHKNLRTHPIIY